MKKNIFLWYLGFVFIFLVSCGSESFTDESVISIEEKNNIVTGENDIDIADNQQITSNVSTKLEENIITNLVDIPDRGYEATINDSEGNVLFAYNVPQGWGKEDNPIYGDYASAKMERAVDGIFAESVDIECRTNKGYVELYDKGEVNSTYIDVSDGQMYTYDGDVETPYGIFKVYNLDEQGEYCNDREFALFKLNEKWCVIISIDTTDYMRYSVYEYLKDIVRLMLNEKEEIITIGQEFDYYLYGINSEIIFGFDVPNDMKIGEWTDETKVWLENEYCQIWITEIPYHMTLPTYGCDIYSYTYEWKESIETIYGVANIYECSPCEKVAIFNVNGHYIEIMYRTVEKNTTDDLAKILKNKFLF